MTLLRKLAGMSRGMLTSALIASALSGLLSAALVASINQALVAEPSVLPRLGLRFALLGVAMWGARWLSHAQFARLGQATLARLRLHVGRRLTELPYRTLELQGPARQMSVLVEDIGVVAEFFVILPRLGMQGGVVLGCLAYLATLSWQAFALALTMVLAGSRLHYWAVRRASHQLQLARLAEDGLYAQLRALFAGAKELKLHERRRAAFVNTQLAKSVEAVRSHRTRGLSTYVAAGSVGAFLFFAVIGSVIFLLGALLDVDPAVRSGYALMFLFMMHPMEGLLEAIPDVGRTQVALRQIDALCAGEPPCLEPPSVELASAGLTGATHAYRRDDEDGSFVLGPIDLSVRRGELLFIVGGNGSGKTTLAKLLLGLYEPEAGQLLLNERPVSALATDAYRQNFSAVFADFHLFERLLGLMRSEHTERAAHLLRALDLEHKVTLHEGRFSTTALSRGQRKRMALLVACLEDRPAYLFDEWAADQDPAYKHVFYTQILPELKARDKAVVVITHDDRYFGVADRVLRVEAGKLVPYRAHAQRTSPATFALPQIS